MAVAEAVRDVVKAQDPAAVATLHEFMRSHQGDGRERPQGRFLLMGPEQQVELPEEVYQALTLVVEAMSEGRAVQIMPRDLQLTTQQAADLLNVSRPTLITFLEKGHLPYERVGSHRRLRLEDVVRFREQRRQAQYDALDATAGDDDLDPQEAARELKRVRAALGAKRRSRATSA